MSWIMVAIDGSPSSEKALEAAVRLAQQNSGQVTAVTVLDTTAGPPALSLSERLKEQARRRSEEVLQAAFRFAKSRGVWLRPVLREGHPAESIIACAEEETPDVLVMGSHDGDGAGLGGTADQVSSHSPCTVMIVR